jgi:hypothetical protein
MNKILEVNVEGAYCLVEPGMPRFQQRRNSAANSVAQVLHSMTYTSTLLRTTFVTSCGWTCRIWVVDRFSGIRWNVESGTRLTEITS